jgi:cell division topological specificity factor
MSSWFNFFRRNDGSAQVAKDRLQIIVARERTACGSGGGYLPQLQQELLQVIAKYERVDLDRVNVSLDRRGDAEVLELSILLPESDAKEAPRASRIAFA